MKFQLNILQQKNRITKFILFYGKHFVLQSTPLFHVLKLFYYGNLGKPSFLHDSGIIGHQNNKFFNCIELSKNRGLPDPIATKFSVQLKKKEKRYKYQLSIFNKILKFTSPINWNHTLLVPNQYGHFSSPSFNLDHLRQQNIDIKYTWELNRYYFLPSLGLRYGCEGNKHSFITIKNLILSWIKQNPINRTVNWKSGLEIAIRLINWQITILISGKKIVQQNHSWFRYFLDSVITQYLTLKLLFNPNRHNHAIGEATGLLFTSYFLKQYHPRFQQDFKTFQTYLFHQLDRQILSDGVNIELTTNYHRFTAEFFLLFYVLADSKLKPSIRSKLLPYFRFLLYVITPTHKFPHIGDNDDGFGISPLILGSNPYRGLLKAAAEILNFTLPVPLSIDSPPFLIVSRALMRSSDVLYPEKPVHSLVESTSSLSNFHYFAQAGYLSIRTGWDSHASFLLFDMADYTSPNGVHDHCDIGNIILFLSGDPIFVDTGTYRYNCHESVRNTFRSTQSHNVVQIGGQTQTQAKPKDFFTFIDLPHVTRRFKTKGDTVDAWVKYSNFNKLSIKRQLICSMNLTAITVLDSLEIPIKFFRQGKNYKKIIQRFHLHPSTTVNIISATNICLNNRYNLFIETSQQLAEYHLNIEEYAYSPSYGKTQTAQCIEIHYDWAHFVSFHHSNQYKGKEDKTNKLKIELPPIRIAIPQS